MESARLVNMLRNELRNDLRNEPIQPISISDRKTREIHTTPVLSPVRSRAGSLSDSYTPSESVMYSGGRPLSMDDFDS
jgi:hypothetical protein